MPSGDQHALGIDIHRAVQHEGGPFRSRPCGCTCRLAWAWHCNVFVFHERRIYETLEIECDRMCHVVDFRRSIVCRDTGSIDRSARQVGGRTGACSGKLVRRTDRDGEVGLRKRTKCIECTLLRYVGYGSLGLREELLPESRARPGSACQARQRSVWLG